VLRDIALPTLALMLMATPVHSAPPLPVWTGADAGDLVNVATVRDCANVVASAKTRRRYVDGPERTIDGRMDTCWRAGDPGPQWLEVDWKFPRTIVQVTLTQPEPATPTHYRVLGKMGGVISGEWETLAEGEAVLNPAVIDAAFDPLPVKSIRVELTPADPNAVLAVSELQAFAPRTDCVPDLAWHAQWIWHNAPLPAGLGLDTDEGVRAATEGERLFRCTFDLPDAGAVTHAGLLAVARSSATVFVNGVAIGGASSPEPSLLDLRDSLRDGRNVIAIRAEFEGRGWAGFVAEAAIEFADGPLLAILTGEAGWRASLSEEPGWAAVDFDDSGWAAADAVCPPYQSPHYLGGRRILEEIAYHPPGAPAQVSLMAIELPTSVMPGAWATIRATVRADQPLRRDYGFVLTGGWESLTRGDDYQLIEAMAWPETPTSEWRVGESYPVETRVWVPEYAPRGETIDLQLYGSDGQGRLELLSEEPLTLSFAPSPPPEPPPGDGTVAVVPNGEGWVISHGGEILTGRCAVIQSMKSFELMCNEVMMGHRLFSVGTYPHYLVDVAENEDANVDLAFRIIDRQIRVIRSYSPDARFLIAMIYRPTAAFLAEHEDQRVLLPDGRRHWTSTASPLFRDTSERVTHKLVTRLLTQPYAHWIIGYELQALSDGTFRWFGHADGRLGPRDELQFGVDLSEPALAAWREWLRAKYGTDEALRAAWQDPDARIATAMPPVEAMRRDYGGAVRDPIEARAAIDYFDFRDDLTLAFRTRLAEAVRSHHPGGAYIQTHSSVAGYGIFGPSAHLIGTGEQFLLADARQANCLGQNHAYAFRRRDEPYVHQTAYATNALHGLLTFSELDNRTFLSPVADYKEYSLVGSRELEKMYFGADLCMGMVERRLNFEGGRRGPGAILWCGSPELAGEIERLSRIEQWAVQEPWRSDKDIAVFYSSDRSSRYVDALTPGPQFNLTYGMLHHVVSTLGAPCDIYQIEDVVDPRVRERHRLFVFLNAEVLSDEQCAAIERLKSDGRTLLFLWAPGYVDEQRGLLPERVSAVTGIDLAIDREDVRARIEIEPGSDLAAACTEQAFEELLPYANRQHFRNEFGPHFYATDPAAEVLGRYAHNGQPGLVMKRDADFTSVFCGSCFMPREVLQWIAREAGAHIYVNDSRVQVSACRSWLVARNLTGEPMACEVGLKRPGQVVDAFTGERLRDEAAAFTCELDRWETRLFYLGERDCPGFPLAG